MMTDHPEDYCEKCGNPNPSWVVDSDRFNAAMKAIGLDQSAIVCPMCFIVAHWIATGLRTSWKLEPSTPFRPSSTSPIKDVRAKYKKSWSGQDL